MKLTYERTEPLILGTIMGLMYGIFGLIFYFALHAVPRGMTFIGLEFMYVAGGMLGGGLVSICRPLGKFLWGRFLLGILATFPIYFIGAVQVASGEGVSFQLLLALLPAVVVGGAIGLSISRWNRQIEGNTDGWWQAPKSK